MSISKGLLEQSKLLAASLSLNTREVDFRRAISSAYYALFHLLIEESVSFFGNQMSVPLRDRFHRLYSHTEMKDACEVFKGDKIPSKYAALLNSGIQPDIPTSLSTVALNFVTLQKARHQADYQTAPSPSEIDALKYYALASDAFAAWESIKSTDHAKILLTALLHHSKLMKYSNDAF